MKLFTIKDLKAEIGGNPFTAETTAAGIRVFAAAVIDPKNQFNKWPEDFALYELGDWNPERLEVTPYDTPRPVSRGDEWANNNQQALRAVEEN